MSGGLGMNVPSGRVEQPWTAAQPDPDWKGLLHPLSRLAETLLPGHADPAVLARLSLAFPGLPEELVLAASEAQQAARLTLPAVDLEKALEPCRWCA